MPEENACNILPENALVQVSSSKPERKPPSSALVVQDGQVILPETRCVAPDGQEFEEVLTEVIPQDELPELLNALHAQRPSYSLMQKGCFLAGFLLLALLACWLFPRFPKLTETQGTVIEMPSSAKVSSRFTPLLKDAEKYYGKSQYNDVIKMLKPAMQKIMEDEKIFRDNKRIPFLFFDSCIKGLYPLTNRRQNWLALACQYAPDNLEWQIFKAYSQWMPYQNCYTNGNLIRKEFPNSKMALTYCQNGLSQNTMNTLDKMECQVLVTIWLLDGARAVPEDNIGVKAREKAYKLAARHEYDLAFIEIQLSIVKHLRQRRFLRYYFNGKMHNTISWKEEDELKKAITDLEAKMNRLDKKEAP